MAVTTAKLPCSCRNEYQDKQYGKGIRLHNFCTNHPNKAQGGWRCSVCGTVKSK